MSLFDKYLKETGEYGVVYQVAHPIVFIDGLPKVKAHEVIMFEGGQKGEVSTITKGKIEARTFSYDPIKVGTRVTRTDKLLSIGVGRELLGRTINPLGEPLDSTLSFPVLKETRDLDAKPVGISGRQKITTPLSTGISLIDLMVPLGRGQRELIIGDRKTGKTSILLTTIKKQIEEGVVAVYACVAKKKSDIKKMQQFFIDEKLIDKMVIVATSSYDSPSLIYQTPYAGMAIAEYFRDEGQNTLLILDDLSSHAKFYRELSLLGRRFPGRDSYPGDIFYVHSKLLERAGNFKHPKVGEVSISCLPVVEIVEGDFTSYISTNVMGITDGHIYLDSNIYYQGMRPAVNIPLSVTRVGRQTLDKLQREVNKTLTAFLTQHTKVQNLSHFGQELTDDVKRTLRIGELVYKFFNQPYHITVPVTVQLVLLSMLLQDMIENKETMEKIKAGLIDVFEHDDSWQKFMIDMATTNDLKVFNDNVLKNKDKLLALAHEKNEAKKTDTAMAAPVKEEPKETAESTSETNPPAGSAPTSPDAAKPVSNASGTADAAPAEKAVTEQAKDASAEQITTTAPLSTDTVKTPEEIKNEDKK